MSHRESYFPLTDTGPDTIRVYCERDNTQLRRLLNVKGKDKHDNTATMQGQRKCIRKDMCSVHAGLNGSVWS